MFERDLAFFIDNQDALVAQHGGKTLVIREQAVVEVTDSPLDAYLYARKHFEAGTFLIQPCVPGPDAYTVTISSSHC